MFITPQNASLPPPAGSSQSPRYDTSLISPACFLSRGNKIIIEWYHFGLILTVFKQILAVLNIYNLYTWINIISIKLIRSISWWIKL